MSNNSTADGYEEDQWGHSDGKRPDRDSDYIEVSYDKGKADFPNHLHACHAVIWAANNDKIFGVYPAKAAVMMQVRFDGYLGFAGGVVDEGEDLETAVNRELREEIGLDLEAHKMTKDNHLTSHVYESGRKNFVLHFYSLEVSLEEFLKIEKNVLNSVHYGTEVFGTIRVPLYTMEDGMRGLPVFLAGNFVGNARSQLIKALRTSNILTDKEITQALSAADKFRKENKP